MWREKNISCWTQVAAVIRVDDFRLDEKDVLDFDEIFGKECLWGSDMKVWEDAKKHPDRYLPMGSEGTLQKSVWVNPNMSHMDAYTVSIFGSLRDCSSSEWIIEWMKNKINEIREYLLIRQAVITASCGAEPEPLVWVYDKSEEGESDDR